MLTGNNSERATHYATPEDLRVGLYVYIDLPWFRHPFTLNSFRIASDSQVRDLRALKVPRFRFDPERSVSILSGSDPVGGHGAVLAPAWNAPAAAAQVAVDPESREEPLDPRTRQLRDHNAAMARAEKSFSKALRIVRRLDRELLSSQPAAALEEMGALLTPMVEAFLERPEATLQVMGEKCGGEEAYHHGLNVAVLSMMLAQGLELAPEQAAALGIGSLLHDIGLSGVPDRLRYNSPDRQTRAERELRARHVEYGVEIGRRLNLPRDALAIIAQHHELADGSGYPHALPLERMAPLARVVSLVNRYENVCNPGDPVHAMTPHEALSLLYARCADKFEVRILQLLIRSLGVYPPGSIVRLSDDTKAVVMSVNPNKPLRPWVLPYVAGVPREEAVMLNLETETERNISEAIRPAQLPAREYAYLCPRKRISYFFDAGASLVPDRP